MSLTSSNQSGTPTLPLYESLAQKNQQQSNVVDTECLTEILTSLDPQQAQQVALLLIHHYYITTGQCINANNLPYGIKLSSSGKGFSFDPNMLTQDLLCILNTYCTG